jgi:integrase/recombinase XerC/integrase/recombinase XerD
MLQYLTFVRPHYAKSEVVRQFFVNMYGKPLSVHSVKQMMFRLGRAIGVPRLHPHLLRHTSATQYLVTWGEVISLQHKLGHSGLEMTNRSVHFAAQELAAIQERVAPMDKLDVKPMWVPRSK